MKRLTLESVMNLVTVMVGVTLAVLVIINILNHGIGTTAAFEF